MILALERFREAGQDDWGQRDRFCVPSSEIVSFFLWQCSSPGLSTVVA